ncbi:MAG TPA: MlaE family lipid ABC transporter permease subunit [Pseudolabrys sp.]|nr:MlaE family lipid ABC transporter permease subunit [Pseudolabrys sp.]
MSNPTLILGTTPATLVVSGPWTAAQSALLEQLVATLPSIDPQRRNVVIDISGVEHLDTLGAWLLERLIRGYQLQKLNPSLAGVPDRFRGLLDKLHDVNRSRPSQQAKKTRLAATLETVGRGAVSLYIDLKFFLAMLGASGASVVSAVLRPRSLRATSVVYHLYRVGWQAVPIMLLITFLIGGIIAQQGIFHFRKFGADAYVVDMVGILVLREIGVLIVSIMVAGRSGSAYTAELGSMKMREEVDALRTMGLDVVEVLILPRILALICALPILTFLGSMAALYGGGLVAWVYGGMSPEIFIARLREAVSLTHFEVGIIKAPFMALVIGTVACSEGLRVKGSAESLGLQTTTSVVKSIFLVIVLDGLFAVFFASIGM